jgi:predicted transcriptional regulator of viral defense system
MRIIELKKTFKDFTLFSLNDIKKWDNAFFRVRLNEWQNKGYIKKIVKGYYIFSDLELNENVLYEIGNRIYNPSYISFQTALSYYGLIPESVYAITSASTRRTYHFKTPIAEFIYRTIAPRLFFGYDLVKYDHKYFKMASMEKAILDYFYVHSDIKGKHDFESLRINKDIFYKQIREQILGQYLDKFAQKALTKRIQSFLVFLNHA